MVHHLHFVPSFLYDGIRRSWFLDKQTRNMHEHPQSSFYHLEDQSPPLTFPPLRLIYFQILSAYNHQTQRIDYANGSCLFCTLACAFHSHQHTDNCVSLNRLVDLIPDFSGLGTSWARALSKRCYHFTHTPYSNAFFL